MAKPVVLLSIRSETAAADDEYASFARCSGLPPERLDRIDLTRESVAGLDLGRYSGILLGGGAFTASDPVATKSATQQRVEAEMHALLDRIVAEDYPFLGVCYGIGVLGTHQGATIDGTYPEAVGAVRVRLTDAGRTDPLFAGLPEFFEAYGGHKEGCTVLPDGAIHLASTPTCPVQAFRIGERVYAAQFHPELDYPSLCTRIDIYKHEGYFAPDTAEQVKSWAAYADVTQPHLILRNFVRLTETT